MRIKNLAPAKLSTRTALLFGAGLFAIAAICLFCARYFFLMNLNDIEQQQILKHSHQARAIIDILVHSQGERSYDWANWDESYYLVTKGDEAYRDRNLYYDGLKNLDLDMMLFLNREGEVIESSMATAQGHSSSIQTEVIEQILSLQGTGEYLNDLISGRIPDVQAQSGFISVSGKVLIVSVTPIRNSLSDSPVGGWLIWGRYLSAVFPSYYSEVLSAENTLVAVTPQDSIESKSIPLTQIENDGKDLAACVVLNDFNGKPLAILKSSRARTIFQEGNQLISWLAVAMLVAAIFTGILTLLAFRRKVGSRFIALEKGLEALVRDEYSTRMVVDGNDEFSMVGEVINQILTKSSHTDSALNDVAQKFEALYSTSNLGLVIVLDGQIVDANDTLASILHYPSGRVLIGQPLLNLCPESGEQSCKIEAMYKAVLAGQRHFDTDMLAADGSWVACKLEVTPIKQQNGEALMLSVKDVSQQKMQEGLIKQLEKYDTVTGLVNRQTLFKLLEYKLTDKQYLTSTSPSLLYIRIERFNIVAGAFGHQMADEVLVAIARELKRVVGKGSLGRVADSEFAFVLTEGSRFTPYRYAKAIIEALDKPILVEGVEVRLSVSVGLVLTTKQALSAEKMMNAAEYATYCAGLKTSRIQLFTDRIAEQQKKHILIQRDISNAIRDGSIYPKFQPLICGTTEEISGFEALARWYHPELGEVSPAQFIPMAESRELIIALGNRILDKSCEFLAQVNSQRREVGLGPLSVHVNLSSPHFSHSQLLPQVQSALTRHQIEPENLTIEITESMLIGSTKQVIHRMQVIKNMGVKLALDDFGTGYSALNSLCEFPLDVVKLDQSFVKRIGVDYQGEILISSVVSMSKALGLKMVAEGVETEQQKLALQALNVEELQGYYFYTPMSYQESLKAALVGYTG
ncbi:EAL domain-containing protein [Photobacterium chitinilyticum]|uniref:EAL domain-containing protein n=1 Tax=Photobacterium chitinilyticum TaxID=2485123 RepID=A0A444JVA9_9GAMM|nr:EAL domain-containing protein [Photobacterium chitinilyticum]RWX57052.1 EAL domain-containing protein [Photobacterium chitinilyticum]